LHDGGWLTDNALIVAELATDDTVAPPDDFTLLDEREYGETKIIVLVSA
jgi:16S rRNA (guanine966-N2)-methyltransferase